MIVGIVVECIAGRPFTFEPLGMSCGAMLGRCYFTEEPALIDLFYAGMVGGMLWCIGNITGKFQRTATAPDDTSASSFSRSISHTTSIHSYPYC